MREDGKIDYIELPGTNLPATKSFYAEAFGWGFIDYGPEYAAFENGGVDGGFNADVNGVAVDFTEVNLLDAPPPPADVLLAGDICYEKPLAERVMAWLAVARAQGATVLIGDPGRSYFPKSGLTKLAEYQVPTTRELEDFAVKRTAVWTLDA